MQPSAARLSALRKRARQRAAGEGTLHVFGWLRMPGWPRRSARGAEVGGRIGQVGRPLHGRRWVGHKKAQEAQKSDFSHKVTELGHRGGGRLSANTAKCRERSGDPRNPRETLSGLLREMFLPRKSVYPKRPIWKGRKILRAGKVCRLEARRGAQRRGHPSALSTGSPRPRSSDGQATSGRRGPPSVLPGRGPWRRAEGTRLSRQCAQRCAGVSGVVVQGGRLRA